MAQNCECNADVVNVPVRGLELALDRASLPSIGGGTAQSLDYTLEEQWTGQRWIDGKKIYQKTLVLGPIPVSPTTQRTPMGVTNIDTVVGFWGIAKQNNSGFLHLPRVATGLAGMIECWVEQKTPDNPCLVLITTSSGGGYAKVKESFITIQYTCSDR